MASLRRVTKNMVHFLCSSAMTFLLGMVASVAMARSLGPNDLGIFHQVQWFAGTVSVVISLGFITSITKFTAQFRAEDRARNIVAAVRFIFKIEMAIALVTTIALLIFSSRIADHYFSPQQTWIFMLSFIAITPGIQTAIFSATLEGAQIFRYQTLHSLTITPLALITKLVLMLGGYGLVSLFWINLIFSVINLAFYYFAARHEGLLKGWFRGETGDGKWKGELLSWNRSMIGIHFVDLLVWSRTENYFLGRYCPAAQIAYYNLAHNLILKLTGTLPNLMWKILLPLSSEQHGKLEHDKMKRTFRHSLRYSAFAAFPCVTVCYIAAYELIIIFYGREYSEVKTCFQILCGGALLASLSQAGSAVIYASNRQNFILGYGSVLAVLNIGLNFWLVPAYGATGAAVSYSVTTSLGVVGGFVFTTRTMGYGLPWGAWGKSAAASLLMGALLNHLLKSDPAYFTCFEPMMALLDQWTGHDFDMLLGPRAVRLMFACAVSGAAYLGLVLLAFKPGPDDLKIMNALDRFLPRPLAWVMNLKLPSAQSSREG